MFPIPWKFWKCYNIMLLQSATECYYKVRQLLELLQSATIIFITKRDKLFPIPWKFWKCYNIILLQSATEGYYKVRQLTHFITKCDSFWDYYKVRHTVITKCDSFFRIITKCDVITKWDATPVFINSGTRSEDFLKNPEIISYPLFFPKIISYPLFLGDLYFIHPFFSPRLFHTPSFFLIFISYPLFFRPKILKKILAISFLLSTA